MGLFKGMKQGRDALRAAASIQAGADPNDPAFKNKNEMQDPVTGSAKVVDISGGSGSGRGQAMWAPGSMKLIVTADGVPATEVEWRGLIKCMSRPHTGQTIPITVDPTNPQNISIEWTELPTLQEWVGQTKQWSQEAKRLKEQRESGAITEAQFEQEKRRLLREMPPI